MGQGKTKVKVNVMIKLLASDLDGTIIDNQNKVTNDDLNVINKLNGTSVNFAICTGKTYAMTKKLCDKLHPSYGIFGNGTQIVNLRTGEEIARNIIPSNKVMNCLKIARDNHLHVHIYTDSKIIVQGSLKYMAFRNYVLYKDQVQFETVDSLESYIREKNPHILKLVISGEKDLIEVKTKIEQSEGLTAIQIKKYDVYKDRIINQEYEYLDIVPKYVTKYEALKQLSEYLDIQNEEVMAVGDNINDIEMIKNAGVGVAIGGSYEIVKNVASYVTKNTVKTGGFAEAVYKFIKL